MPRYSPSTLQQTADSFPVVPITVEEYRRIFGWELKTEGARRLLAKLHSAGYLNRSWQTSGGTRRLVYFR